MNNVADKLYNILGTKFDNTDIKTLDSKGKETIDMEEIEMFSFDFVVESRDYGPVVILLSATDNLEVYYGDNTSRSLNTQAKKKWENLIEHLSTFARGNRLGFSLKHTSDLKYDLSNITDITDISESYRNIFEGYYGTTKTSYNKIQEKAKIIIRHSKKIGEEDKRFRNISELFIENADGERFKLPFTKLTGARAMARHVTEGGNPYDLFGVHICEMVKDINTLGGFVRRSKCYEGNEEALALVETGRTHYNSMRKGLKQIAGKRGYHAFKEGWEPSEITEQDTDTNAIRSLFTEKTVNQRTEDALPLLARLQQMAEADEAHASSTFDIHFPGASIAGSMGTERIRRKMQQLGATPIGKSSDMTFSVPNTTEKELDAIAWELTQHSSNYNTVSIRPASVKETSPQMQAMEKNRAEDSIRAELSQAQVDGLPQDVERLKNELADKVSEGNDFAYWEDGSFVIDTLSGSDSARVIDALKKSKVGYDQKGPLITIHLNRDSLGASVILSKLHTLANFDEIAEMQEVTEFENWADGVVEEEAGVSRREHKLSAPEKAALISNLKKVRDRRSAFGKHEFDSEIGKIEKEEPVAEDTRALPETGKQIKELQAFMSTEQPVGLDAINAIDALQNILADERLVNSLEDLAATDPDGDARVVVQSFIENMYKDINQYAADDQAMIARMYWRVKAAMDMQEGFEKDLDADSKNDLNASFNKDMDNTVRQESIKKDNKMKPFTEYVSEAEADKIEETDEAKETETKEWKKPWEKDDKEAASDCACEKCNCDPCECDKEEVTEAGAPLVAMDDQNDLGALMQRTNFLLNK